MTEKQKLFVEIRDAWGVHRNDPYDFEQWLYKKHCDIMKKEGFNSYKHMDKNLI